MGDMSLEQDYGITIDYGTPGPILEPHQDEYIGQAEDTRKMESEQNLNRRNPWQGLCDFTGRCKRELPPGVGEVIGEIKDEKIMESGKDLNRARRSPCRFRLQRPLARARGVWRTRTWSRNRTTSLRSWNRTRTRLSDRTRTRTSCNQDKTSIAASTSAPPGAGGARGAVGGAEAARSAGGARGVLE